MNEHLREFLEITLPPTKPGKKAKYQLGVAEPKLGSAILEAIGVRCVSNDVTIELFRGIRRHLDKLIQQFKEGDLAKAQLGLGHSFSRAKVRMSIPCSSPCCSVSCPRPFQIRIRILALTGRALLGCCFFLFRSSST